MKPLRILQIVCDGAPGGGTNHVMQVLNGMPAGIESALLTQDSTYLSQQAADSGIDVFPGDFFRSRTDRAAVRRIEFVINTLRPDLIHCHGGRAAFFRSFCSSKVPTIYTVHGFHFARKGFVARNLGWLGERRSIAACDHVVFVSDYDHQLAVDQKLLPRGKAFSVIHNGIPIPKPDQSAGDRSGIGFIGRLVYQKHPQQFVKTVSHLPGVSATLIGGGVLFDEVQQLVNHLNLQDRLRMTGEATHQDALNAMNRLDALVMTPRWEGLPLLPIEAMCLRVPVISTPVGGVPEVVRHEETGLLAETPEQLAAETNRILTDSDLRQSIVDRAYEVATTEFAQQTMLKALGEVYRNAASIQDLKVSV